MNSPTIRAARLLPWLLCALLAHAGTCAAEDDKRVVQMRETARRAQAALQQAQQELASARAERDKLAVAEQSRQADIAAAQARERSASVKASGLRASLEQAQAERDKLQEDLAREQRSREELANQLEAMQNKMLAGQSALEEQRRLTQTVAALLERSVKSLAAAEEANRTLHALGLKAVEAYTERTPEANWAKGEPFFGLATVRLSNEAEELRHAMANQRVAPSP